MIKNLADYNAYRTSLLTSVEKHLEALREIVLLDHAITFLERGNADEQYQQSVSRSDSNKRLCS